VAEAFYLTNNIEKYGSGFIRIRNALRDYPEVSFEVQEMGGGVLLTFGQNTSPLPGLSSRVSQQSSEKSSEKILDLLRSTPTMSARRIAQHLDISQRTAEKHIEKLKLNGLLRRVGSDRGGYWHVLKERDT
jgi:ATP-dependent DNA helicase RecG